jgi:PAS domain S-box/diguanylate cyclase (GGDEF) domain
VSEESVLANVATVLPDAALLIDAEARVRWGNRAAERLFGMSLGEAIGVNALEFVHPDDVQFAALAVASVQSKDVGSLLELRVRSDDGWRLVEMIGAPLGDEILLSVRDLTERRRWEIAGDEVARFRSLMQNSASLTILLTGSGGVTASSVALTRLLGHDQEWIEGRPFSDLVDDGDHTEFEAALREVRLEANNAARVPVTVDLRLRHIGGDPVPFALTFSNFLDDPTVEGLVVTGHDIADRVRAVDDLRASNSVLAATLESTADGILVVDRSGHITNYNGRFVEMWRVPPEILESREDAVALSFVLDQLVDPDASVAKVQELYADPESQSHDSVEFKDGRVVERDSFPQRIGGEVVGRVWSFRDVTEHRRLQGELSYQAFHDPLTGLANQALFRNRVDHATSRLERLGGRLGVLFIDLDNFKTVNDSLGHATGDDLLRVVGERLTACLRNGDTAARLGGDEFAVLIDDLDEPGSANDIAARFMTALAEPVQLGAKHVATTASIGIAFGDAGTNADEMLRNADLAMYTAKGNGKNCTRVYAPGMHGAAVERLDLETHLRGAAERGELVVNYQPIYELRTQQITAFEALVRWQHPDRGLLPPVAFIPFAETGGLIDEIGNHVLLTACREAERWSHASGTTPPSVSVNLSPRQLLDADLPARVEALLNQCGLDPTRLILEITENALIKDPAAAAAKLARLGRLGVRLAVDDFGTGYSSLAYLQHFPIHMLKIDRSFLTTMRNPESSLVAAIVQISHTLGLIPIAEGVENQTQADALIDLGCDLAQGFHLGRPLAAEHTHALLERVGPTPVDQTTIRLLPVRQVS